MADVNETPKIRCDNCGKVEEKRVDYFDNDRWIRPEGWGSARVEHPNPGNYSVHLAFTDLCNDCLRAAFEAAGAALKKERGET